MMDIFRSIAEQDLAPSGDTVYGGVWGAGGLRSVYRACREWEKKRGIVRDSKSFVREAYAVAIAEKNAKIASGEDDIYEVKNPKVTKSAEELRELKRASRAKYRAKDPERTRMLNREYQRKAREKRNAAKRERYANMTEAEREAKRVYERERYKIKNTTK